MSTQNDKKTWYANQFRFTGFPISLKDVLLNQWWEEVVGQPPEVELNQAKLGIKHIEGLTEYGRLILEINQGRIDWILSVDDENIYPSSAENLGEFSQAKDVFFSIMKNWFSKSNLPIFSRVALGCVLLHPVENKVEGYKKINELLNSVKIDPINSSDFLFQINLPRNINWQDQKLIINRLTKWSVGVKTQVSIPLTPDLTEVQNKLTRYSCRLELDINTSPKHTEIMFDKMQTQQLIELFSGYALEIAENGDVS